MLTVEVPRDAIVRALWEWNYLPGYPTVQDAVLFVEPDELTKAVEAYQAFNGLTPDGVVGPWTAAKMINPARCGLPDMMLDQSCAWPHKDVTFHAQLNLPGLAAAEVEAAFVEACQQWSAVCGINLTRSDSPAANIVARSGTGRSNNLDGRGGTLAWSELPCGRSRRATLQQMYDEAEQWSRSMAVAVICHEVGHAIGLSHIAAGNLLAPYYDPRITKPQAGDIAEAVKRYGPPQPKPSPAPAPGGASDVSLTIKGTRVEVNMLINGVPHTAAGNMRPVAAVQAMTADTLS